VDRIATELRQDCDAAFYIRTSLCGIGGMVPLEVEQNVLSGVRRIPNTIYLILVFGWHKASRPSAVCVQDVCVYWIVEECHGNQSVFFVQPDAGKKAPISPDKAKRQRYGSCEQ
jgi:hypothetical protein